MNDLGNAINVPATAALAAATIGAADDGSSWTHPSIYGLALLAKLTSVGRSTLRPDDPSAVELVELGYAVKIPGLDVYAPSPAGRRYAADVIFSAPVAR